MNYWAQADGSLEKRAGIVKVVEVAGDQKITMLENFQDHLVFAYGTTVASVYLPTLAVTTHKSDFLTDDPFRGVADGNYFYFCNGSTQIQYLTFAADGVELIDPAAWVRSGTADFSIIPPQEWLRLETSLVSGKYVIYYTSGETGAWAVGNTVSDGTNSATIASYTSYGSGYSRFSVTAGTWAGPGTELGASLTNTTTGGTATRNGDPSVADAIYIAYQPITVEVNAKYQVQYKLTDYTDKEKLYFYSAFDQTDLIVTGIGITQTHILNAITDGLSSFYVRYDPGAAKEDINITEFSVQKMDTATLTLKGDLSGSPRCKVLYGAASRLFAGNIIGHEGRLKYSGLNDGTTPPYTSWTDSTTPGAAGQVDNTMLGDVVDIKSIGTQVVILYEQGKSGFRIDETGATKLNLIDYSVKDAGAVGKACATPLGIVYMNSKGIWAVSPGAASNIPYSDFQMSFSKNLGSFEDYDFTDSDIAYYPLKRSILITCKYGTDSGNNRVLVYNLDTQGWSMLDLELSRFYIDADNAYGGSSTQTKIFELFSGTSDDGEAIESNFEQELSVGDLHTRKDMLRQWVSATLDTGSNVGVNFDIYNTDGTLEEDAVTMSLNEDFEGGANVIRNFQRIILKIRDISELGHTIHWVKIDTREKTPIRNRGLSAGDIFQLVTDAGDYIVTDEDDNIII